MFFFGSIFDHLLERGFERFGEAVDCFLGVPSRGKSSDFVKDILEKLSFAYDQLPEPFLKPPGKDSRPILGPPWEPSWRTLGLLYPKTCVTFWHTLPCLTSC